jgi:hypothetical protein
MIDKAHEVRCLKEVEKSNEIMPEAKPLFKLFFQEHSFDEATQSWIKDVEVMENGKSGKLEELSEPKC